MTSSTLIQSPTRATGLVTSRAGRSAVVTGFVGLYVAIGLALGLGPIQYLLLGVPLTIAFQLLVARRPIHQLWLLDARPFRLGRRGVAIAVALAIVPALSLVAGVAAGDPWSIAYAAVAAVGAIPAGYAIGAMDARARRALLLSLLTAGLLASVYFIVSGLMTNGAMVLANVPAVMLLGLVAFVQYIPVTFVLEEVTFRGALDTYARGPMLENDRRSAVLVSALWGFWHLPVEIAAGGIALLPWLVLFHGVLGVLLTVPWRRSGNLAVPGITHALADGVRDAVFGIAAI
jgi:membrane protease YdiL (CAAX protease family)